MGINAIVMVITLVSIASLLRSSKLIAKIGGWLLLTMLVILYAKNTPWIFETNKTRMPLMGDLSFSDRLCESSNNLTKPEDWLVVVPIGNGRSISIPSRTLQAATEKLDCQVLMQTDINDSNWNHGVARNWSGLILKASSAPRFIDIKAIRFVNSNIMYINRLEISGEFINIYFDGPPLDGELVGYPHKIELIK